MKVRVTLVVDVDQEAWCEEYGTERSNVREDVKSYVLTNIQGSTPAIDNDIFTSVSLA